MMTPSIFQAIYNSTLPRDEKINILNQRQYWLTCIGSSLESGELIFQLRSEVNQIVFSDGRLINLQEREEEEAETDESDLEE